MSFLNGRIQSNIAAHPLPTSSGVVPGVPAVGGAPDFASILGRLRRSFLDEPLEAAALKTVVRSPLNFLRVTRLPRRSDDQGRQVPAGADREGLLLTALHGLGQPIALRVDSRAAGLTVALGIASPGAIDTLGRSMTSQFPGSQFAPIKVPALPPECCLALLVGIPLLFPSKLVTRMPSLSILSSLGSICPSLISACLRVRQQPPAGAGVLAVARMPTGGLIR